MNLTDDEKKMRDGDRGAVAQKCMEFLIAYGEAAGAERLVDLDGTVDLHPGTFWVPDFVISPEEIEELANRGEKFKVPTFANKAIAPAFIYDGWEACGTAWASTPHGWRVPRSRGSIRYWVREAISTAVFRRRTWGRFPPMTCTWMRSGWRTC
jgi:hypothetical protein